MNPVFFIYLFFLKLKPFYNDCRFFFLLQSVSFKSYLNSWEIKLWCQELYTACIKGNAIQRKSKYFWMLNQSYGACCRLTTTINQVFCRFDIQCGYCYYYYYYLFLMFKSFGHSCICSHPVRRDQVSRWCFVCVNHICIELCIGIKLSK